jgi:hypothetical protein
MKLALNFSFFKARTRGAELVWIKEAEIDIKFLK